ncbi:MAG: shikimate dehydrogenase [Pedobacter sp.]|nr:MAG: shikimate dehydrogenase [Pedobacter sp.]
MRTFGLIGYPLSHSFSKKFFTEKFETEKIEGCEYELFPLEKADAVVNLIDGASSICGLNVTIPHKVEVLPFLNELDDAATEIGAVNCISVRYNEGSPYLKGYNTDAFGFSESLKPLLEGHHKRALILGDGGASKAVKYVLRKLEIPYLVVVRRPVPDSILYDDLTAQLLNDYTILINTTPLGMSPNYDTYPNIPYQYMDERHLAYDLVYNPEETVFLQKSKLQGATVKNGLEMLYLQAERSWFIWNS